MSKKIVTYSGKEIEVKWDGRLCIHIGECGRAKGELFVSGRDPWCQPDAGGEVADVVEVVDRCPTGALTYRRADGLQETAAAENTVFVANRGPLYVRGELEVDGAAEDMEGAAFRVALCRCGKSQNKPFCDNAHEADESFTDRGAVGDAGPGNDDKGGSLSIKRAANGPLLLNGNFTIVSSGGRATWSGTKAALCRCGASKNKPFCDGAHRDIGFEAE